MSKPDGPDRLGERIVERARDLGFALCGVTPAARSDHAEHVKRWLADGKAGEMAYIERLVDARLDPRAFVPGCRSLVVVADQYHARSDDEAAPESGRGRIARYARGRDYHKVMKTRLHALADGLAAEFPGETFRSFVDTAPVLEREHAARAGIGWIGKHTLLIHPRRGSWLFLGGIATTMAIAPPRDQRPIEDHCGMCTRCIDACPTAAIAPYSVDATRCIAYLTIEHRSAIDPALHAPMGDWVFGCDICQDVCPHNSARTPPHDRVPVGTANAAYAPTRTGFDLLGVLGWTEEDRRAALAGTPMTRATLAMWKRNALIAAGNALRVAPDVVVRARIDAIAGDPAEDPMVRATARDVLAALI
jgi:epoxyqueuosine reductase